MTNLARKSISDPVDSDYVLGLRRRCLDFLTKFGDVIVAGASDRIVLKAPYLVQ